MKIQKQIDVRLMKKVQTSSLRVVQFDTGVQLVFNVLDFELPSETTATFYARKKSGKFVYQENGITVNANTVTVDLENQALTEHGEVHYQLRFLNGSDTISTFYGSMFVDPSLADADAEESKTVVAAFNALTLEKIAEIEAATDEFIAQAQAKIADKGVKVLATIPADYTETSRMADSATRTKADAIICSAEGDVVAIKDASDDPLRGLKLFGKSTQDGTPVPETPVDIVSIESPVIGLYGKNLIGSYVDGSKVQNGVTFTVNSDGSITIDGTATEAALFNMVTLYETNTVIRPGAEYIISGATSVAAIQIYEWHGSWVSRASTSSEKAFTLSDDAQGVLIRYVINPNQTADNLTVYPMLRLVSDADSTYEQGKTAQTIELPYTLCGIPVESGGNYTDANGQQWLCDEVDLERGVYVQRIGTKVFDGSDDEIWYFESLVLDKTVMFRIQISDSVNVGNVVGKDFVCTHFKVLNMYNADIVGTQHTMQQFYFRLPKTALNTADLAGFRTLLSGSPMTVTYAIANPVETALTAEEIEAFKAICTNYPNTTVLNDAGAWMEVKYNADAKTYIENKISNVIRNIVVAGQNAARLGVVNLRASAWMGSGNLYSQVVTIDGITEFSQVNLTPTVEQMAIFYEKDITFVTENDNGVVTVYVIGQKPQNDYTIQASIVEVII